MKAPVRHVPSHNGRPDVGSHWAYRARSEDPLLEVEVLRLGAKQPPRVKIRFVDEGEEGREEWVPPARLKVLWSEVSAFIEREARWRAVNSVAYVRGDPQDFAASEAIGLLVPDLVHYADGDHGVSRLPDVDALAAVLDIDRSELSHPVAFLEDGDLIVPWPVTLKIAETAVTRNPDVIAHEVFMRDQRAAHEAVHGTSEFTAETLAAVDLEFSRPIRDTLRRWCGVERVGMWAEYAALQAECRRLRALTEDAIGVLRAHGHMRQAKRLERSLESSQRPPAT